MRRNFERQYGRDERDAPGAGIPCHRPQCKITVNGQAYCDEGRNCNR